MSSARRCSFAALAATAAVVAVLGSPPLVEAARDSDLDTQRLLHTLVDVPNWDVQGVGSGVRGDFAVNVAVRLATLLVLVGLLAAVAGRSRSRGAAWLGGWGAVTVAGGAAGLLSQVHLHHTIYDGRVFGVSYTDMLVTALQSGTTFGLLTGWAVGLAAALACRPQPVPAWSGSAPPPSAVGAPPPPPPGPTRVSEPPPPWWAPTGAVADGSFRPGPTAYPPGGLRPAAPEATYEMPTASGEPHPSDPGGTPAVDPDDPTRVEAAAPGAAPAGDDPTQVAGAAAGSGPEEEGPADERSDERSDDR